MITDNPIAEDLLSVGAAWQSEVQIDVFAGNVSVASNLANIVFSAFNNAQLSDNILSCESNQVMATYDNEDETIRYTIRVFVNHKITLNN